MASATDAARAAIESQVSSVWASRTDIQWADRPFTAPSTAWLRCAVLFGAGAIATMDGLNRVTGVVALDVFAPQGDGIGTAVQHADAARYALSQREVGAVRCGVASGPVEVAGGDGAYTQLSVSVPFTLVES